MGSKSNKKDEEMQPLELNWRCDLPQLFDEVLVNPTCNILQRPLQITLAILLEGAERAIELEDEKMLKIFKRLNLVTPLDWKRGDPPQKID